ncbi:MAG: 50S ribosomal protein L10 [Alphaproteobacteria bacterium]|nr:50S ribosomal protein L10 [Alphaproteobacteria bacterium]
MLRERKIEVVKELTQDFTDFNSLIITHYHGLTVKQVTELRTKLFEVGVKFIVVKNRLVKLALKDSNFVALESNFSGPTAIALSNDPVAVAKILIDFSKENEELKLIKGFVEGSELDLEGIKTLSKMPSLDELRAKIISLLQTPASSVASVLTAPSSSVVRVVSAYSEGEN